VDLWRPHTQLHNFSPFSFEICTLVTLRQNHSFVQSACNWKWARQTDHLLWYLRSVPLHATCSTGNFTGEVIVCRILPEQEMFICDVWKLLLFHISTGRQGGKIFWYFKLHKYFVC